MKHRHPHVASVLVALLIVMGVPKTLLAQAQFAVGRYSSASGELDGSFAGDGMAVTDFAASDGEWVTAVTPYPKGKVVAAGCALVSGRNKFAVARYKANGSLDPTFNRGGKILAGFTDGCATAVGVQEDGKVVVAGESWNAGVLVVDIVRYKANGSLDTAFNGSGRNLLAFASATEQGMSALSIQADGKIVVVGNALVGGTGRQFAVARLTRKGFLDTYFGRGGMVLTNFPTRNESAAAVAIQADGKIVVGGEADNQFALARYNSDGTPDVTFNSCGMVVTNFTTTVWEGVLAVTIQGDGKIVAAGRGVSDHFLLTLARYNANGSPDSSLGTGGVVTAEFSPSPTLEDWTLNAVAIGSDGKVVVAGAALWECTLARYNADGSRDTTFGSSGTVVSAFNGPQEFRAVGIDATTARIIAAGDAWTTTP